MFEEATYLWTLMLIPFIGWIFSRYMQWKGQKLSDLGDKSLVSSMLTGKPRKEVLAFAGLATGCTLMFIAAANLLGGAEETQEQAKGSNVIFALDISRSMLVEDVKPSRLQLAKHMIGNIVEQRPDNRYGIVVFTGSAIVLVPVTHDHELFRQMLDEAGPDLAGSQGTSIAAAIGASSTAFENAGAPGALIVFSDGEDHEAGAIDAAETLHDDEDVIIHTVGVGTTQGEYVPGASGYVRDEDNSLVVSKINEEMLREVADAGDGIYVHATGSMAAGKELISELDKLDKEEYYAESKADRKDFFQYFLLPGIFCLAIFSFLHLGITWRKET